MNGRLWIRIAAIKSKYSGSSRHGDRNKRRQYTNTYMGTLESANICIHRTQIFVVSSFRHFRKRMVLNPLFDFFW